LIDRDYQLSIISNNPDKTKKFQSNVCEEPTNDPISVNFYFFILDQKLKRFKIQYPREEPKIIVLPML